MYRCRICRGTSLPRQSRLLHIIYGPRKAIKQEIPVCANCKAQLEGGESLRALILSHQAKPTIEQPEPEPEVYEPKPRAKAVTFAR